MKIGYARVSTEDQRLTLQLDALKQAGCTKFFREKVSGAYRDRPELNGCLTSCAKAISSPSGNSTGWPGQPATCSISLKAIREAGARFQSISEPWADTTTHAGKLIMTIFAGIAEFERDLIRERTAAGRADARKRGVRFGRPKDERRATEARPKAAEGRNLCQRSRTHLQRSPATLYRMVAPAA